MASMRLFICYSRADSVAVQALVAECRELGQDVWFDQEPSGGQQWWDAILERIRRCDCFVFALSKASISSRACLAELEYAHAAGRPILPVTVAEHVPGPLLPPLVAGIQCVDMARPHQLARALLALPIPPPHEHPPPSAPPVPVSYLEPLSQAVERRELSPVEQRNVVDELKSLLQGDDRDGAIALLLRLRQRSDVVVAAAEEIDKVLRKSSPPTPSPAGVTSPPPTSTASSMRAAVPGPAGPTPAGVSSSPRSGASAPPLVFLSYASQDRERVRSVVEQLTMHSVRVFWDRRIPPGQNPMVYLGRQLEQCACVIVVWTKHSVSSKYVRSEAQYGYDRDRLVPIRLDDVEPPFPFADIQAADFITDDSSFDDLLAAIDGLNSS